MELLSHNMDNINISFDRISGTLRDSRSQISKLSSVNRLLDSLQFIFKLPANLRKEIDEGSYSKVVPLIDTYIANQSIIVYVFSKKIK